MTKLLGLSGSLRAQSSNRKLINAAAQIFAPDSYITGNLRLPLYDGDIETAQGIPAEVKSLADHIRAADAVIISTPEYNKALSGVLKNALDWVSRTDGNPWVNKPVAIMSAAAGRAGGERAQFSLRLAMVAFRPNLLQGPELMLADSNNQFDADGHLINDRAHKTLTALMTDLRALT